MHTYISAYHIKTNSKISGPSCVPSLNTSGFTSSIYHPSAAAAIHSNNNTKESIFRKANMSEINTNDAPKSVSNSRADDRGLVAIIVVLILVVLGSAAAYLLMRWHFAKARGKRIAAGEQVSKKSEMLTTTGEKVYLSGISDHGNRERERGTHADVEDGLGRRRSGTGGDKVHTRL
ncbi:hypothetical protein GGR55DRAFT_623710 [Xylaria sp. FL0064]|nr:hypothetical protein GGR55DRAFT_623710 [Xylaria sp. FL0064]